MLTILFEILSLLALASALPYSQVQRRDNSIKSLISTPKISSPPPTSAVYNDWPEVPFKKLAGFSPWFPSTGVYGIDGNEVPEGCKVTQVQVFMRHAERLASGGTHRGLVGLAAKLANSTYAFKTDDTNLKYLQSWNWTVPAEYLSPIGSASAYAAGAEFAKRYEGLLPQNAYYNWTGPAIPVRSSDQQRVNQTANSFVSGFLGSDWSNRSSWSVTPDSVTTFNSTIASNNCPAVNTINSKANGIFNAYFWPLVVARLSKSMPGFNLTADNVGSMMNACPFDSFVRQSPSPICSIFTAEEWKAYNYAIDLTQFDNAGYGGPIGSAWGVGWVSEMIGRLNGTTPIPVGSINTTLSSSKSTFPLNSTVYLDFTHDSSLESAITAMGLLKADYNGNVTIDQIDEGRNWQSGLIAPMGGRLFVERMSCPAWTDKPLVRLVLNDAIVPLYTLPECQYSYGADRGICDLPSFIESQKFALSGADFANCVKNYTGIAL